MIRFVVSVFVAIAAVIAMGVTAEAGSKSGYYRGGPQVKGYVERRGGYSYSYAESVNTYGDSRSLYGGASAYRDPMLDRQTNAGPFDHGFFFDFGRRLEWRRFSLHALISEAAGGAARSWPRQLPAGG